MEYLPLWQRWHNTGPFLSLYLPSTHAVHGSPSWPVYPLLHVQTSLPDDDDDPEGQLEHEPVPADVLYFPATQWEHVPPSGP